MVAPAVPRSPALAGQLPWGLKLQAGFLLESSGVGRREPSASTVSTHLAMPLTLLAAALARAGAQLGCGKVSCATALPLCQGKGWPRAWEASALQRPSTGSRCPASSTEGWSEKQARGEASRQSRACNTRCMVQRAARLAGNRIPQEPALQELTDLNSSDFFPYLFSRQAQASSARAPEWHGHRHPQPHPPPTFHCRVFPSLFRAIPSRWMRRWWVLLPRPQHGWIPAVKQWMWRR